MWSIIERPLIKRQIRIFYVIILLLICSVLVKHGSLICSFHEQASDVASLRKVIIISNIMTITDIVSFVLWKGRIHVIAFLLTHIFGELLVRKVCINKQFSGASVVLQKLERAQLFYSACIRLLFGRKL